MGILTTDINAYCNLSCEFCYQDLYGFELSKDQLLAIVDDHPEIDRIEIGGGEPFLHRGLVDIVLELRELGKLVHISTNATAIPQGLLDLEEQIRQGVQIQASLHASNTQLYQAVTGEDLFDAVLSNIRQIAMYFDIVMSAAIYQTNFRDVPNLVRLASDLNLPLRINPVFPAGRGKNVEILNKQQINWLRGYLLSQRLKSEVMVDSPLIHTNNCFLIEKYFGIEKEGPCPSDNGTKLYVSPKGEITVCEFMLLEGLKWK